MSSRLEGLRFVDRQQTLLLALHGGFEQNGIVFAFPTRTLHIAGARA